MKNVSSSYKKKMNKNIEGKIQMQDIFKRKDLFPRVWSGGIKKGYQGWNMREKGEIGWRGIQHVYMNIEK